MARKMGFINKSREDIRPRSLANNDDQWNENVKLKYCRSLFLIIQ